jgi:hypothetical protein
MSRHSNRLLLLALAVAASACAPKAARTYVAPTANSIDATTEMSYNGEGHVIVVTNRSTVPIVVTGVSLVSCENIKNRCDEATRMKVRVPPGQRKTVLNVRPENPAQGHGFRFTFAWTAEGTDPLAGVTP